MTLAIDLHPPRTDGFVTATGGVRSDDQPGGPPVTTIDSGELDDISGGIVDGTRPFPLPRPDGLPPLPATLPRPSPTTPLGPFDSSPRPDIA